MNKETIRDNAFVADIVKLTEPDDFGCPPKLSDAVLEICRVCTTLNRWAFSGRRHENRLVAMSFAGISGQLRSNLDRVHEQIVSIGGGGDFLWSLIPFASFHDYEGFNQIGSEFKALVNPHRVLGWSHAWLPEHIKDNELEKWLHEFGTNFDRIGSDAPISYRWYRKLGIVTAGEGKNRVALMQKYDRPIAATVREFDFPDAARIKIIEPPEVSFNAGTPLWFAILDNRYICHLKWPVLSARLLGAYGCETCTWEDVIGHFDGSENWNLNTRVHSALLINGYEAMTFVIREMGRTCESDGKVIDYQDVFKKHVAYRKNLGIYDNERSSFSKFMRFFCRKV